MNNEKMGNGGMNAKLKHFVSLKKGKNPSIFLDSGTFPYLTMDYLRGRDKDVKYVNYDENLVPVKENEILILWDGANAGEIMRSKVGFLSSTMAKISSINENLSNHFLFYLLKNFEKILKDFAGGTTIPHLDPHVLLHSSFFIPSLNSQTAIAKFLDDKTAKIDRAIAQKEKMIALLKERKQIIIQNAVTKGLNPNTKMKSSGVEWIGEIPEGWEVKKIKHIIKKSFSGGTPSTDKIEYWDGGIPWISSVDVKSDFLSKTTREISGIGLKRSSSNMAPKGSVVFVTRSGILQHTFAISILEKDMAINQDIKCLIFSEQLYQPYFLRLIQGNNSKILVETRQQAATVESINMDSFFNLIIPIPPKEEQSVIVTHIETQSTKIDKAIALQEHQIEKLKELKSTLIDSAVTGKLRVPSVHEIKVS